MRPTKYSPEILKKTEEYLRNAVPENMDIPTIEGLSIELDVDDDTIVCWAKKHKELSAAIKRLKRLQKKYLMNIGLFGGKEINSNVAVFLLKANHGMMETDKREIDIKSDGKRITGFDYKIPDETNNKSNTKATPGVPNTSE